MSDDKYYGPCNCSCHDSDVTHIMTCCAYNYRPRAEAEAKARALRETLGKDNTDIPPKYAVNQRVKINGWTGDSNYGIIEDIKRVYHNRIFEWVWGYHIKYDDNKAMFAFDYVPQGYLQECDQTIK